MLPLVTTLLNRYHRYLLAILWLLRQVVLYQEYKVRIVYDSRRYLYIVDQVVNGTYQPEGNLSYFSYILFLAAFVKAGLPLKAAIVTQVLLNGLTTICFYKIAEKVTQSQPSAFYSALLLIIWPDLLSWNFYIHTETIFVSLSSFVLYLLLQPKSWLKNSLLLVLLLIILFIRPNGFMVLLAVAGLCWRKRRK